MLVKIVPAPSQSVKRLVCPSCRTKVPRMGFAKGAKIDGLLFNCKCGYYGAVSTEEAAKENVSTTKK